MSRTRKGASDVDRLSKPSGDLFVRVGADCVRRDLPWRRRLAYMTAIYVAVFSFCFLAAEIGFRLFWSPKYWIHTSQLARRFRANRSRQEVVARHEVPGRKQRVSDRVSHQREGIPSQARAERQRGMRIASHSSAIRSPKGCRLSYESTFCARLEKLLAPADGSRAVVCENFGVSATDLLEYWHRIHHDVLANRSTRCDCSVHLSRKRLPGSAAG